MRVTFLGTGTSMGIPLIGCDCEVCRSDDNCDKRTRTSAWIQAAGTNLIIDTGIDFRQQALRAGLSTVDAVLFTHHHVDHIFGLDDLRPVNILQKKSIAVYADKSTMVHLKRVYPYIFNQSKPNPDLPKIRPRTIDVKAFEIDRTRIIPIPLWHADLPVFGFRIGNFAWCTDVSLIPEDSYRLLEGLEVLVLGALRHRVHPKHFTVEQAVREAQKIGARQTYLVHMTHEVSHRELANSLPPDIQPAFDGMVLELEKP